MTASESPKGEKLFRFLASLMLRRFYGTVTIRFEAGTVTHIETATRRVWDYEHLPVGEYPGAASVVDPPSALRPASSTGHAVSEEHVT